MVNFILCIFYHNKLKMSQRHKYKTENYIRKYIETFVIMSQAKIRYNTKNMRHKKKKKR